MSELRRNRRPTHPGMILRAHYMEPRGISVTDLADALDISRKHASQIINGHTRIEPMTAVRLSRVLGTTPRFWLNLQASVDEWDANVELADWQPRTTFAAPGPTTHPV